MKIIEQYVESKTGNPQDCEDSIFISNDFAAVIDGVTSKSIRRFRKNTPPGKESSLLLKEALGQLKYDISVEDAVLFLTKKIFSFYEKHNLVDRMKNNPLERATASIIIYSRYQNEIWSIGDCQCLVDNVLHTNKKYIDELLADVRALFLETEERLGKLDNDTNIDIGRNFILPLLKKQFLFQNVNNGCEYSYGVIDGFNVPKEDIKTISVSGKKIIVLASDGYPKLCSTLKQSENQLKKILKNDPLCYKEYKSTKGLIKGNVSFDDRAYLKIELK